MDWKQSVVLLLCALVLVLSGCAAGTPPEEPGLSSDEVLPVVQPAGDQTPVEEPPAADGEANGPDGTGAGQTETDGGVPQIDDTVYVGEYLDGDAGEPRLEIARTGDGAYVVQIGIYRLTSLDDGVGELTGEGLRFTATDANGAPIGGVITIEGETATVTFTDSTWTYLPNGTSYTYTKSSDTPTLWG